MQLVSLYSTTNLLFTQPPLHAPTITVTVSSILSKNLLLLLLFEVLQPREIVIGKAIPQKKKVNN